MSDLTLWESIIYWINQNFWPIALTILAALVLSHFTNYIISAILKRALSRLSGGTASDIKKRQETLASLLGAATKVAIWLTAVFTVLQRFDINLVPLLAGASVMGVAIGFGAQSLVKDFFSGLFIILENQYRVGDLVEIGDSKGIIEKVTIRSTIVRDNDGNAHYIPNGGITKVVNKTMGFSKVNLTIAVDPETDIDKLAEIINNLGDTMAHEEKWKKIIIQAPHFLSLGASTEDSLEVKISGTTMPSKQWGVTSELRRRLIADLKKHKLKLAQVASDK